MWQQLKELVGKQVEISHPSIDNITGKVIKLQQDFEGKKIIILLPDITPEWQAMERQVDEELAHSEYKEFDTLDDLLADLFEL